jgi:hypothetical protein
LNIVLDNGKPLRILGNLLGCRINGVEQMCSESGDTPIVELCGFDQLVFGLRMPG